MSAMLTMIWPMAGEWVHEVLRRCTAVDGITGFDQGLEQGRSGHARPARQAGQLADRRGDVGEDSVVQRRPSTAGPAIRIGTGLSE